MVVAVELHLFLILLHFLVLSPNLSPYRQIFDFHLFDRGPFGGDRGDVLELLGCFPGFVYGDLGPTGWAG